MRSLATSASTLLEAKQWGSDRFYGASFPRGALASDDPRNNKIGEDVSAGWRIGSEEASRRNGYFT